METFQTKRWNNISNTTRHFPYFHSLIFFRNRSTTSDPSSVRTNCRLPNVEIFDRSSCRLPNVEIYDRSSGRLPHDRTTIRHQPPSLPIRPEIVILVPTSIELESIRHSRDRDPSSESPPSYETVERFFEEPPPTYAESVKVVEMTEKEINWWTHPLNLGKCKDSIFYINLDKDPNIWSWLNSFAKSLKVKKRLFSR